MRKIILITLLFLLSASAFGQTDKASINSWRGLVIDQTTFDQAVAVLGKPVKDKPNETLTPIFYSKWFGNKMPKGFREATFKNIEGLDSVVLSFKDDKLVVIEMDMKKDLSAAALTDAYDTRFYPLVGNFAGGITPNDLANNDREIIFPERFPAAYYLASANDKTIGFALASMGFAETFAATLSTPRGQRPGLSGTMPGIVRKIQLISRSLENKKGVNLLK